MFGPFPGENILAKKTGQSNKNHTGGTAPGFSSSAFKASSWGRWFLLTVFLLLVLGFVYQGALTKGQVFQSGDAGNAEAFRLVGDSSLADGDYPQWNPFLFGGMPSFGSLSYMKYVYPPSVMFNTLQGWGFPPLTWMFGHLLFGGLGMAWLLSRFKLPFGALVLGAVIWLLFPKVVAWGVHGHGSKLGAAMYMPWIVGSIWRVLDGKGWRAVGLTSLFLGLQLLRGHVQITYYTLGLVTWLAIWNAVWPLDEIGRVLTATVRWRRVAMVGLGIGIGFMIGAVLLLPVHDYANISIRGQDTAGGGGVGIYYATGWSLAPQEYGTTVFPLAAGFGKATYLGRMPFNDYPNYFGFLMLFLVAAAWSTKYRSLMLALLALSLLAVFVSFGNFGFGFYQWLYGWLPYFNKFRVPSMILILPAFAAAVLAPLGITRLVSATAAENLRKIFPPVLGGLGLVLLLGAMTGVAEGLFTSSLKSLAQLAGKPAPDILVSEAWHLHRSSLILIGLVLLTGAAALWGSRRSTFLGSGALIWVLVVLIAIDLGAVDKLIVQPDKGLQVVVQDQQGRARLAPAGRLMRTFHQAQNKPGPSATMLKNLVGSDRVFPLGTAGNQNLWMADQVRSLGGYHPAKLAVYDQIRKRIYSEKPAGRIVSWLAGRIVSFEAPFSEGQLQSLKSLGLDLVPKQTSGRGLAFYENKNAVPRARLLTKWEIISSLPEKDALEPFLDGIQTGRIDVIDRVFLDAEPSPRPENTDQSLPEPVFVKDGLNEVVLQVESPVTALLLLSDMMTPGWTAEVDGESVPILQADLVLRAVAVEAGKHTVRFQYSDPSVRQGLTLSVAGGILALMLFVLPLALRRRALSIEGNSGK